MSIHKSLKLGNTLVRRRNVLKRIERIQALEESGKWTEGENSVFGLAKIFIDKSGLMEVNREEKHPVMVSEKSAETTAESETPAEEKK